MSRNRVLLIMIITAMLGDFVVRGVAPAFSAGKNDFSDLFCGARLWRHGQNPYDIRLATEVSKKESLTQVPIVPIYPPTSYVLLAPFSMFSWRWANVVWALLGIASIGLMSLALLRMLGLGVEKDTSWLLVALVVTFAPFHTAIHVGNAAALSISICIFAVYLASLGRDLPAGATLALAACLKPQLGFWIILFYIVRKRWHLLASTGVVGGVLAGIALVRVPLSPADLMLNYGRNLHYWFGIGGQNDFTDANPLRFQLVNVQTLLYPLLHSVSRANLIAWALFTLGAVVWVRGTLCDRHCPDLLALSSLLALSFLSFYHRVYDVGILILGLCWAIGDSDQRLKRGTRSVFIALLPFLVPGQAILMRLHPHLDSGVISSWWWTFLVEPHAVWALLLLNVVLLCAVSASARGFRSDMFRRSTSVVQEDRPDALPSQSTDAHALTS